MQITIKTNKNKEVIDLTDIISGEIAKNSWKDGVIVIVSLHTTCSLTTADLDPGTDQDLLEAIGKMFPEGNYRHPHDPSHVSDHIMSSLLGPSLSLIVENGKLLLGTWQRIVLVELSGPRERTLALTFIKN